MNFLKQLIILCACLFVGSILKALIPLPIPETIYGMLLLFILFAIKAIKTDDIRKTSDAILDNFAFLFVPAGVGIIENLDLFKQNIVVILIITIITAAIALAITMLVVEAMQKRMKDV